MQVGDVDLVVRDVGAGRPFVWTHGLMSSMAQEDEGGVLAPAPIDGVRLVRYDARGHGASEATYRDDDYTWPALSRDLVRLLDAIDVAHAVVGGASMGAATALHVAVTAPERVDALVLVIPPTAWRGRRMQAGMYRTGATLVSVAGMRPFAAAARAAPPPRVLTGEMSAVRDAAVHAMAHLDRAVVPHILRGAAASDLPAKAVLERVSVPALILAWEGDPTHPTSTAEELAGLLPGAALHVASEPADVTRWPGLVSGFVAGV